MQATQFTKLYCKLRNIGHGRFNLANLATGWGGQIKAWPKKNVYLCVAALMLAYRGQIKTWPKYRT